MVVVESSSSTATNRGPSKLQRYVSVLSAFVVTLVVTSPSLKAYTIIGNECPGQSSSVIDDYQYPPITKSKSRGFRPVYIFSKQNPPPGYSQAKQDTLVLALTKANDEVEGNEGRVPFFVDLAANDAIILSNSLLLEKNNWNGVCFEPNPMYWYRLSTYRTCTILGTFVGGTPDQDGKEVDVILSNAVYGGIVGEGMDNHKKSEEKRNLVSIATAFQEANIPAVIDYFSLDVEGAETLVMRNFPWDDYKFKFITIERPRMDLMELLTSHGYKKVMTIADFGETLWAHMETVAISEEVIKMVAGTLDIKDYTVKILCVHLNILSF